MNFGQAVQSVFRQYVGFSGRARRSEYWWFFLFNVLISIVSSIIDLALHSSVLGWVVTLALLLPGIAVGFRRLHDTGRSAWWLLIVLIPIAGAIVLLVFFCLDSERGENRFGPSPKYGELGYSGPKYGGPQYGGPQYGGPQYGGPQYPPPPSGPQYGPPPSGPQYPPPPSGPQWGPPPS